MRSSAFAVIDKALILLEMVQAKLLTRTIPKLLFHRVRIVHQMSSTHPLIISPAFGHHFTLIKAFTCLLMLHNTDRNFSRPACQSPNRTSLQPNFSLPFIRFTAQLAFLKPILRLTFPLSLPTLGAPISIERRLWAISCDLEPTHPFWNVNW